MDDSKATQPAQIELQRFQRDGFLVVRQLLAQDQCRAIHDEVADSLKPLRGPAEFEADVKYPGAPDDRQSEGGNTPRRLLHAYGRSRVFRQWATSSLLRDHLQALMQTNRVMLSQCHHNCIMTKHPGYSSMTSWHQDVRYWRFDRPELVSVWLALGTETPDNGGLSFIPGSHQLDLGRGRLDQHLFLRTDLEQNQTLVDQALAPQLEAGDAVFFHCKTLHAAGMNRTDRVKLSPVFTYHSADNRPIPGTRSADYPSIPLK
jgi:phytanoyl-CoA hydroxylase